jgi:ketosteroid isomerase-like protein
MIACYHKDIHFEDPAFGVLKGEHAGNMWRMLCASQKDKEFTVTFSDITYQDGKGSAHWEAQYHFSKTGRKVHNKIDATFEFKDGKISKHIDTFNLHRWASQAMGFKGMLLG